MKAVVTIFDEVTGNVYESEKLIEPSVHKRESMDDDLIIDNYTFMFKFSRCESSKTRGKWFENGEMDKEV